MHHHDCGHASWRVSVSSRRDAAMCWRLPPLVIQRSAVERMRDQLFSQFENDSKHD